MIQAANAIWYKGLKFHGVSESEALARIEVEEMYPNTKNKDKGKQKLVPCQW